MVAQQVIHRSQVVQPFHSGAILHSAADQHRPRGHQGVQVDQVVVVFDHPFIEPGAVFRVGNAGLPRHAAFVAQVPGLPIIDVAVPLVEDDAGIDQTAAANLSSRHEANIDHLPP